MSKSKKNLSRQSVKGNFCPRCLSILVFRQRHSDKKYFVGCSKYPNCHYTREVFENEIQLQQNWNKLR